MANEQMKVTKRTGELEDLSFDKILARIKTLSTTIDPPLKIKYAELVMKITNQLVPDIKTSTVDEIVADQCASMSTTHPDYQELASRIVISNHHKNTSDSFLNIVKELHGFIDDNGNKSPMVSDELLFMAIKYSTIIESSIVYDRDYLIDYFGFKTLERAYLMKVRGKILERPQHMWMRVSLGIHNNDINKALETYRIMSQKYFVHATPTLFNAGTPRQQLSSCYLISMEDDSIDGIFNTLKECAQISKWAGGIGLHIHNVRSSGSHIRGTNGVSNGITPMLQVFNATARYVDQGGGKRNGSFAIYLEPWHADILDLLELKKNHGDESLRARDLFYGIWMPDAFMEAVKSDSPWYLMSPDMCQGLSDCYGDKFTKLYNHYVSIGKFKSKISARELWYKILDSQMETGTPYLCYKDSANIKSNQCNLGTIKSSNLCTEIIEYSDKDQTAVCNLASIGLPKFVKKDGTFDYEELHAVAKIVAFNLNKVIDVNYYPTDKTERSNLLHRPIGIGVQGLSDVFAMMKLPFCSDEAKQINKDIFETIYHAAIETSNDIAYTRLEDIHYLKSIHATKSIFYNHDLTLLDVSRKYNETDAYTQKILDKIKPIFAEMDMNECTSGAYASFDSSPMALGIFQFDLWKVKPSKRYNWEALRDRVVKYGIRNSLLVAPMPTASTSQILGNNECFEPFTSNIYVRRTLAGEFMVINRHLMKELIELGMWSEEIKNSIIANNGSIQHIENLDKTIKDRYKIVWEMQMKDIIDMAADRGPYICQSQSMNLWCSEPNYKILTSMHFYSWAKGLKTGMYYLRRKPRHQPQQFTINPTEEKNCEMCSA
jgi:ribonucleoside-diphosphate reductase alpha chain